MSDDMRTTVPAVDAHPWTPERLQAAALGEIDRADRGLRARLAGELHPEGEDRHDHPDPAVRRDHLRRVRRVRDAGLRAAQLRAAFRGLDAGNDHHLRWLRAFADDPQYWRAPEEGQTAWRLDLPWQTPDGIPEGAMTDRERAEWAPSLWEVEQAAMLELEEVHGGRASMFLRAEFPDAVQAEWAKGRTRVYTCLARNRKKVPADPLDPNNWGHDARLASLTVESSTGEPIALTPAFDPDIENYKVSEPLEGARVRHVLADELATATFRIVGPFHVVYVLAYDGVSERNYNISVAV